MIGSSILATCATVVLETTTLLNAYALHTKPSRQSKRGVGGPVAVLGIGLNQ
jgi:hypothetical protein